MVMHCEVGRTGEETDLVSFIVGYYRGISLDWFKEFAKILHHCTVRSAY
jgi:hypothetical protein